MYDPYSEPSPYETLGVSPDSTAVQIRDRYNQLQRDIQESGVSVAERSKRKQQLDAAYNQLRVARQRVRVDFWLLDPRIGAKQCATIADSLATPNTDIEGLVKPRSVRVRHDTMLDEPERFEREPEKVIGLHVRPLDDAEQASLPSPLVIQFDC